ncbi:integrase domain-containing protein [Flexistipes sp.]|uniref:integrase domain-containing protein n=1 Tax=Flexistipes sp. TaxID=3088135 RepID=UPI002E23536D|nr:integrase domain-containing protein [Flexistipes sp.]
MQKVKRNFVGENNLTRKAASFRLATEVVKSANEGTIQKVAQAARMLAEFVNNEYDLKNLAKLESNHMEDFADNLLERLDSGEISRGHATNIISALNSVFNYYYRDDLKISARGYGLNRGTRFNNTDKSISDENHQKFSEYLSDKFNASGDVRYEALRLQVELQRSAGLRFKESALLSGKELRKNNNLEIRKGTKGGQLRTIDSTEAQRKLISDIKNFRKEYNLTRSLIPDNLFFKEWSRFAYNVVKDFKRETGLKYNFHGNRHYYAQKRYKELTGHEPPVKAGFSKKNPVKEEKSFEVRLKISEELGHHRIDITSYYLGRGK